MGERKTVTLFPSRIWRLKFLGQMHGHDDLFVCPVGPHLHVPFVKNQFPSPIPCAFDLSYMFLFYWFRAILEADAHQSRHAALGRFDAFSLFFSHEMSWSNGYESCFGGKSTSPSFWSDVGLISPFPSPRSLEMSLWDPSAIGNCLVFFFLCFVPFSLFQFPVST